ncbi:MAG: carboxymuconolactone decarboxylase family protein [Planctomycetaceae bacterium]
MTYRPHYLSIAVAIGLISASCQPAISQNPSTPKPVPQTRAEMLRALDALKHRAARLPLPAAEAPAPEPAAKTAVAGNGTGLRPGSLGVVNNGRMRSLYLPAELQTRGATGSASTDPQMPYEFSTELFWIVSRLNNCHYCLGHQESKLQAVGVTEDTLLALDTHWASFPEKQQRAFEFTRRLTTAPHTISDAEIDALRAHFSDQQILDIAFLVGRYNSTNRWTDSLGIPQEHHREYTSALPQKSLDVPSQVDDESFAPRPQLNDFATWKADFEKQAIRKPRVRIDLADSTSGQSPHERLLMSIPAAGTVYVEQIRNAQTIGKLPNALKHKIAYVAARQDGAWYMQHVSRARLLEAGMDDQAIFSLAANGSDDSAEGTALRFASKLTAQPQQMTDADISALEKHFSAYQIAEIVYHTGLAAILDRVTEVAGLGWAEAR